MNIHILGACGTFMAGIAYIARELGHDVVGVDQHIYPPMSDFLASQNIHFVSGYEHYSELPIPDVVIIGNALSRGNPAVEHILTQGWHYISGPQWLYENVLRYKKVLAVSGTHGKTTTSSILAWILEYAGLSPSFLIGGIPKNFETSARITESPFFVIEADEYDSAFFDKRSKFLHYRPQHLIINNIEFDHADIFSSIDDIKKQFHYLLRTVPKTGRVFFPRHDQIVDATLSMGLWTPTESFGENDSAWHIEMKKNDGQHFKIDYQGNSYSVMWSLLGKHNVFNACAAIAAAHTIGVDISIAAEALTHFGPVKRRLEKIATINTIEIYEDFAHHPTAIRTTLEGLRYHKPQGRIITLLELASNTMRAGIHKETLIPSLVLSDETYILQTNIFHNVTHGSDKPHIFYHDTVDSIITEVCKKAQLNDTIVIMSNRDFGGIYKKLPEELRQSLINNISLF